MKMTLTLIFVVLMAAVFISGCVQQTATPGTGTAAKGTADEQAFQTVSDEVDQAVGNMTLDDVQNELLNQG